MSFIFEDSSLIEQLLTHGLEHELKFTKKGQAAVVSADQNRADLLQHLKTLQDQLNPNAASERDPNAGPAISHKGEAALGASQLESLGDLIQWLASNETKVDGQVVAYPTKPADDDSYIMYKLETHVNTPEQRGQAPAGVYVNPELLQKYIVSLQANETQHPNVLMQKQLSHIIQDANQQLGLQINPGYTAPERALADATVLDNLPHVINLKYPTQGGNIPLTYGDLKDDTTFNAWLNRNNIALDTNEEGGPVLMNNPRFDIKKILQAIILRAQFTDSRALDAASKERAAMYKRQADRIAAQIVGNATGTPPSGQSAAQPAGQQGGQQSTQMQNLTTEIVSSLPLALQNVDFSRIRDFFGKISQLMGNNSTVAGYISKTEDLMKQTSALTENNDTFFQLGISPSALANMFKDKQTPGREFYTVVHLLDQIVDNVRAVVGYFQSQWNNNLSSDQRALVFGQIGKRPDDNSIYRRNIEYIQQWAQTPHT